MTKRQIINDFIARKNVAVIGVSSVNSKFGNMIYKELKERGYNVIQYHKELSMLNGDKCYNTIQEISSKSEWVIINTKPNQTKLIIKELNQAGAKKIWIQKGSESNESIQYCKENEIEFVDKECILMYAEPVKSVHRFHRFILNMLGKLPK